jgi:hypothetical protein
MAAYPDSVVIEFYNGAAWIDISAYVVGDLRGSNGLGGWKPDQRVAVLGSLSVTLNNKAKLFSPMGGDALRSLNTLSGFTKGAPLRVRVTIGARSWTIWTGRISQLDSDDKNWGSEQTRLIAVDWMEIPAGYPMKAAAIATNQTIDTALALILARLSVQPAATDFDAGVFTFPTVFDNVRSRTMAAGELTKLANSELGYIYVKGDGTLRAENASARAGQRALDTIETHPDDYGFLLLEDGSRLLLEDGSRLILDESSAAALSADAEAYNILMDADSLLNSATVRAYPTAVDTALKVLYSLNKATLIAAHGTLEFDAHYIDPTSYAQIGGTNMQTPVVTTDYLMNTKSDGTGTNISADLTVTATFYGDLVHFVLQNANDQSAYITKLQVRGFGIYYGNTIEAQLDDAASQSAYGFEGFQFDQRYQRDTGAGLAYALSEMELYKNPKSRITKMSYLANLNRAHLMAFLSLSIGALIMLTEDRSGISNDYYITDRAFTVRQGKTISVAYGLKQSDSYRSGQLKPVAVEFTSGGTADGIDYGYLPRVSNLRKRTMSARVYVDPSIPSPDSHTHTIVSIGNSLIWNLSINTGGAGLYVSYAILHDGPGDPLQYGAGTWLTAPFSVATGQWIMITIVEDTRQWPSGSVPTIYFNAIAKPLTENVSPFGIVGVEDGKRFVIGNIKTESLNFPRPFDGKIADVRVYDRLLSQDEVTTLYNAGVEDDSIMTDGLVFHGPAVLADRGDAASLAGTVLSSADRLLENVYRAAGVVNDSPVLRDIP